jgi:hypothetical protein
MIRVSLIVLLAAGISACAPTLDEKEIPASSYFIMDNDLACTVYQSTDEKDIGRQISILDLETDAPRILYGSRLNENGGGAKESMIKHYEDANTLTLRFKARVSSVSTFVINKKDGKFARIAAGNLGGVYAHASLGRCE